MNFVPTWLGPGTQVWVTSVSIAVWLGKLHWLGGRKPTLTLEWLALCREPTTQKTEAEGQGRGPGYMPCFHVCVRVCDYVTCAHVLAYIACSACGVSVCICACSVQQPLLLSRCFL